MIALPAGGVILIDGTGVQLRFRHEWARVKYNHHGRHRFVRVTATCDAKTGVWSAAAVTSDRGDGAGEVSQVPALLAAQAQHPDVLIGDGAYDTKGCYQTAREHDIRLIVPPHCNAKPGLDPDRDVTLRAVRQLGTKQWKQKTGYHTRSLVESGFGSYKTQLGSVTTARTLPAARADVLAGLSLCNY